MTRHSKILNVLSTRALPVALQQKAAQKGIAITCHNFIEPKPCDRKSLQTVLSPLAQQEITAIVTSRNAVQAIASVIDTKAVKWKFFCIAAKTRAAVAASFTGSEILASAPEGSLLAEKIINTKTIGPLVFFCGNRRMPTIPNRLSAANISLREVTVYRTELVPITIAERFDGILFFSPSGVESFFTRNKIDGHVVIFTIGATTAKAVRSYVPNRILMAEQPSAEALVTLMGRYFNPTDNPKIFDHEAAK